MHSERVKCCRIAESVIVAIAAIAPIGISKQKNFFDSGETEAGFLFSEMNSLFLIEARKSVDIDALTLQCMAFGLVRVCA